MIDENLDPNLGKKTPMALFLGFLQLMAGIMSPVIPTLIIAGFFSLILTLGTSFFGLDNTTSTYTILYNISQAPFYFYLLCVLIHLLKNLMLSHQWLCY